MEVVLVSTYELGRQPFGLASPAAWLRSAGHRVVSADLSVEQLPQAAIRAAGLVGFYLPMHTATRLAIRAIEQVRLLNPGVTICCYGLYAPLNESYLRECGATTILGGEYEPGLVALADGRKPEYGNGGINLDRLSFLVPDRTGLPPLASYARLNLGDQTRLVGYTEASRGCKHLCRHCPVVPVYQGIFRVVQSDVVLEDIRRQVASGATHITFGDPDFFNGPTHARRILERMRHEFGDLSFDATIKVEHLRKHRDLIPLLKDTGCLFVTSAVESTDDAVLRKLDKGHTLADFIAVLEHFRSLDLTLAPTFIAFTPWTTLPGFRSFLETLRRLDLVDAVSPIQLALRLLIPSGSLMLDLPEIRRVVTGFDAPALLHRWSHPDPKVDALAAAALKIAARKATRRELFQQFWALAEGAPMPDEFDLLPRAAIPYLNEPWYC